MKIGNIREMSDKELYTFINNIKNTQIDYLKESGE